MLTQWAKTAFLSGLKGVTGGRLTVLAAEEQAVDELAAQAQS